MRSAILSEGRAAPRLALRRTYQDVSIPGRPEEGVVRAEGLEPSRGLRPNGFSYHLRLSPPCRKTGPRTLRLVCGLDYTFTVAVRSVAVRR